MDNYKEKLRGCLLLGALGDSIGYPIEFLSEAAIDGIAYKSTLRFEDLITKNLVVSDDTQMTLFTLEALLSKPVDVIDAIYEYYQDWMWTQNYASDPATLFEGANVSKIRDEKALHYQRAPGFTCMSALESGLRGTLDFRINDSKGCGGVMRLSPIAIYYAYDKKYSIDEISMLGTKSSAITHGHDMSMLASYHLTNLLVRIIRKSNKSLEENVKDSLSDTINELSSLNYVEDYKQLIEKSIELSKLNKNDRECIHELGEGWIAEEAVAIAIYASLKYSNKPKESLLCSVNHKGDSDSTGMITGNILGLYLDDILEFEDLFKKIDVYNIVLQLMEK